MAILDRAWDNPLFWKISQRFTNYFYPQVTRRLSKDDVVFLNFGYEEEPPISLPLAASDEPNRYPIQLYHRTAAQANLRGKRVLEIGCGHGGGASYLMRTLDPASYTGLDLNPAGIEFCRQRHSLPRLDFVQGDAENLPFPDQCFDAVINIESSNHYPGFARFLSEVARVLTSGGHFLYADSHHPIIGLAAWEAALAASPMRMLSHREINPEILRGIENNSQQWLDVIDRHAPAFVHGFLRQIAPVPGGKPYQDLQRGALSYRMYCFVKE